ncbi:MAG: PepSY domain-containing protein [Acidaminobacteraceae bacterium]
MKNKIVILGLIGILTMATTVGVFASANDTSTKNIISSKIELTKESEKTESEAEETLTGVSVALSTEEAKQIAQNSAQGATFVKIELEDENGVIVYGVDLIKDNQELDVKVDANTGQILSNDKDQDEETSTNSEDGSDDQDNDQVQHENENEDPEGYED